MNEFDKTHLSIDQALEKCQIHKDYIAHCHRWAYVVKWLEQRDAKFGGESRYTGSRILDVGCGVDVPLYKTLCTNKMGATLHYTGVDINKLTIPAKFANRKLPITLLGETDILSVEATDANLVTSFEMLEHVPNDYARATIQHLYNITPDDATFILSTPVFDERVGMAANHINEMTREELSEMLTSAGWSIDKNYGTFASRRDIYKQLTPEHKAVYDELTSYYPGHVMATIFAPLYPEYARNNIWVCTKDNEQ